jgi:threonine/homoserine efflux transporter RhtA
MCQFTYVALAQLAERIQWVLQSLEPTCEHAKGRSVIGKGVGLCYLEWLAVLLVSSL